MSLLESQPQPTQTGQFGKKNRSDVWIFPAVSADPVQPGRAYRESQGSATTKIKIIASLLGKASGPSLEANGRASKF